MYAKTECFSDLLGRRFGTQLPFYISLTNCPIEIKKNLVNFFFKNDNKSLLVEKIIYDKMISGMRVPTTSVCSKMSIIELTTLSWAICRSSLIHSFSAFYNVRPGNTKLPNTKSLQLLPIKYNQNYLNSPLSSSFCNLKV